MTPRPGFFLSLDGLDGTGKSTQCRLLADWLRASGRTVTQVIDPGGTEIGAKLRELLLLGMNLSIHMRTECLMFMASRAELVDRVIRPALDRGEVVVSDRFVLANVVYQGHAGGLDPDAVWAVGRFATAGLMPDLSIVFDLPLEAARRRMKPSMDRMERRGEAYHQNVRDGFLTEAKKQADRVELVDASPSVDEVHRVVREIVTTRLGESGLACP